MLSLESLLKEKSAVKYEKFNFIKEQAKDILPKIRTIFPEFNNHDIKHAEGVVKCLNEIIPDEIKKNLSDEEIFCLLCSAWLHDIGMVPNKNEELAFERANEDKKNEIRDKIRDKHHIRSYNFIKKEDSFKLDRHEKTIIAYISRSHRKIDIQKELSEKYRISSTRGYVNLQFLGACLRIADECDITLDRVSKHYIEESRSSWAFLPHIKKHELIDDVYLSDDLTKIIIRGQISSKSDLTIIRGLKRKIEEEIGEVQEILINNGFNLDTVVLDFDEDLLIEKEIIILLSDRKPRELEEIILELDGNEKEIKRNMDNLEARTILKKDNSNKYYLSEDLDSFKVIFEDLYGDDNLKIFIDYAYSSKIIKKELFNYLRELYNFVMSDQDEIDRRIEILKNSPTAIYLSLHGKDIFDPQLNISLIQGQCLLDQLILLGFNYDMYRYPMNIGNIDEFIKKFIKPLCSQICECVPKSIQLYNKAQENAKKEYSEKILDLTTEKKEGKYKFNMGITSKKGEPDILDLISASQKTGYPIEITGDRISHFKSIGESNKIKNIDKVKAIQIMPGEPFIFNLKVENSNVGFNNLHFRIVEKNEMNRFIRFSTEDRHLPYKFEFSFETNDKLNLINNGKLNFEIRSNANAVQLFKWEDFFKKAVENKIIDLIDSQTEKIFFKMDISKDDIELADENWYEFLKKLSYIQKKTRQIIIIPERYEIKNIDQYNTDHAFELLNTGSTELSVSNMAFSLKMINIKEMIQLTEKNEKVPFKITLPNYEMEILKERVNFGPINVFAPSFEILNKDEINQKISNIDEMESININIRPKDEKVILTRDFNLRETKM